ncbi:MAG: phage major capsid protein [Bacteroidales bacterium]|nr:phage major capsid protein [Bacteroidales bacterium]
MNQIFEIERKISVLADTMTGLNDKALTETRDFTADEDKVYKAYESEMTTLKGLLKKAKDSEELAKMKVTGNMNSVTETGSDLVSALKSYLKTGLIHKDFEGPNGGFALKTNPLLNTTASGIIQTNIHPTSLLVTEGLDFGRKLGMNVQTGVVGTQELPNIGQLDASVTAEGVAGGASNPVISVTAVDASNFSSSLQFSKQFLMNASPDTINKIIGDMLAANERKLMAKAFTLAGANTDGSVASTAAGLTYKDITKEKKNTFINLGATAFVTTSDVRAYLENLNAGGANIKFAWTDNDTLAGQPAYVADSAPANKLLWGDWSNMFVGVWGTPELIYDNLKFKEFGKVEITAITFANAAIQNPRGIKYMDVSAN